MRRYSFYLSVALLAFGIGSFVVFKFYWNNHNGLASFEKTQAVQSQVTKEIPLVQSKQERLTCNDKSLRPFWNELKKHESFKNLDELYDWYGSGDSHDCSEFFRVNEAKDLNNDRVKEYFVQGINHGFCEMTADCDFYIFQLQDGKYKQILLDNRRSIEQKVKNSITNGYFDIELRDNDRLSVGDIFIYKFNGKTYKLRECLEKTWQIFKDGDIKELDKPIIKRKRCN